ncbi:vesicular-fusion protein S17 [Tulasnella sp. 424]|nr:vesicular-fusion protein S17 [Tulasnella sp. 424]KAG8969208.1 vesicular-fusion protein S17 [Tulasnella sp. 425]
MAPKLSPAQEFLAKAEKRYNSSVGWFGSSSTKYEEADPNDDGEPTLIALPLESNRLGDLFKEAANNFKVERLFKESGDAYMREAECRVSGGERDDAANAYWNAAKAYKQGYPDLAAAALGQTVDLLQKLGRFRQAADREKEIGQIYLQENHDVGKAVEAYLRAADWYSQEDAKATASSCKKDAADLLVELDRWHEAIKLYDEVAQYSLGSQLTKYNVKEYWLRAGLCALAAQDAVTARRKFDDYSKSDLTFPSTREARFLLALIEAAERGDQEAFTGAVYEYDQVTKLDNWKTQLLLKIKKGIQDEPALL